MANSVPVKVFMSTHAGAPTVSNNWGDLTAMLDACLVTGYNVKSITTLSAAAGVATVTSSAHGFVVDQVVLISGATPTDFNGEFRVVSVPDANTFTIALTNTSTLTGSGTITVKAAPLGFSIAFTGTNKRAYRSNNPQSNRPYLRVDDSCPVGYTTTWAKFARVTMAQGMSDVDTFVGLRAPYDGTAPTKNEVPSGSGSTGYYGWFKWYFASTGSNETGGDGGSGARNWVIIGDDRGFYFLTTLQPNLSGSYRAGYGFTDFDSYKAGDGFNSILIAHDCYGTAASIGSGNTPGYKADFAIFGGNTSVGKILMTDYFQVGAPVGADWSTLQVKQNSGTLYSGYDSDVPFPNGPNWGLLMFPAWIRQKTNHMRGKAPGLMACLNPQTLGDKYVVSNVTEYPGRKFLLVWVAVTNYTYSGSVGFDITGPWH